MDSFRDDLRRGGGCVPPPPPHPPPLYPLCPHGPSPPPVSAGSQHHHRSQLPSERRNNVPWWKTWMKKYVVLCFVCGGLSVVLGIVLIVIYLLLRSYTSSLQFFETIPTYVPGIVLIITGLIILCFAKRKNRYAYLMKIAGGCCLICALLCVVITVTTTVVHMNRLQTLHECVYTPQAKTCICVSSTADHSTQDAHRFVFNNTPNCEVVHGSLYSCLRALFSFSVIGILVCIFSSMLVYQLLSHEKKRIYWEQLELRRRFLYQRHPHHAICGCYEDLYPWQLWEMLDYRLLTSHALLPDRCPGLNGEEEPLPHQSTPSRNNGLNGNSHRSSNWNWLPWPRQSSSNQRNGNSNVSHSVPQRQSFVRRLMSRDCWNQQLGSRGPNVTEGSPVQNDASSLPWRSECIHIFRPSPRNSNCAPPVRFGIRSRNSPYSRHYGGHRRTRSNDGVFHHLHMNSVPRYAHPYPLTDNNVGISCHFTNCEIPRYMWGPPPPYSQPPSIENIPTYDDGSIRTSRRSVPGLQQVSQNIDLTSLEIQTAGNNSVSSKVSTPLSERRFLCHNFSSEGITLTIGNNFSDIHASNHRVPHESKQEETCIVEVHVPYIFHKNNIVFNTLPTRSCRKKDTNPFKSLSNIPLGLSRKLNNLKQEKKNKDRLSVIETCCEIKEEINCSLTQVTNASNVEPSFCDALTVQTMSQQQDTNSVNTSPASNTSRSFISYQPTLVEIPSDFKSSLLIATSPSTPVTDNLKLPNKIYAQSMPNLSISNSPLICRISRVPSSGNTSTSQDFADFDFEEDSSPLVLCSPVSDVPQLPEDNISDNSCVFLPCPQRFRTIKSSEVPFSSYSSASSCEVSSSVAEQRCVSPTISNSSATSNDILIKNSERERDKHEISHKLPPSSSIILCERPLVNCSVNCNIHHLHRYHPARKTIQSNEQMRDGHLRSASHERTNNFIVTIKSVNV